MTSNRILKFTRTDENSFVLVHVSSKGSNALDLKLVGTEGAAPYACSLVHNRVSSFRAKNCPVSEIEWENILLSLFQQELSSHIQATAAVQSDSSITLTIRKQIQGFTQRLGAIVLNYEENETIELFHWCAISVDALTLSQESANKSIAKLQSVQASVDDLKSQLEELIKAKREDEVVLLRKLRDLLNEKKVKIREQQKVIAQLSSSNAPVVFTGPNVKAEPAAPNSPIKKATKRKAQAVEADQSDNDLATVFKSESEVMDTETGNTTGATASVISDDDEDKDGDDVMNTSEVAGQAGKGPEPSKKQPAAPPPRRSLPFQRKKPAETRDESDSDDEL